MEEDISNVLLLGRTMSMIMLVATYFTKIPLYNMLMTHFCYSSIIIFTSKFVFFSHIIIIYFCFRHLKLYKQSDFFFFLCLTSHVRTYTIPHLSTFHPFFLSFLLKTPRHLLTFYPSPLSFPRTMSRSSLSC